MPKSYLSTSQPPFRLNKHIECTLLRGRPFNSWGGGGGVGDFEKKFPASACRKKKIACSTNVIEKKFLRCCKKEKKMLQSYFIIPGVFKKSQQNCNHSFPLLTLNSGFDDAAKLLLHMCNALLAYHKQYYKWR